MYAAYMNGNSFSEKQKAAVLNKVGLGFVD